MTVPDAGIVPKAELHWEPGTRSAGNALFLPKAQPSPQGSTSYRVVPSSRVSVPSSTGCAEDLGQEAKVVMSEDVVHVISDSEAEPSGGAVTESAGEQPPCMSPNDGQPTPPEMTTGHPSL